MDRLFKKRKRTLDELGTDIYSALEAQSPALQILRRVKAKMAYGNRRRYSLHVRRRLSRRYRTYKSSRPTIRRRTALFHRKKKLALRGGLPPSIHPFPHMRKAILNWTNYSDVTHTNYGSASAGSLAWNCFQPTKPSFDDANASTSGQANWGDTLSALYHYHQCRYSRITITIRSAGNTETGQETTVNNLMFALFIAPTEYQAQTVSTADPINENMVNAYRVTPFKRWRPGDIISLRAKASGPRLTKKSEYSDVQNATPKNWWAVWDPVNTNITINELWPKNWIYKLLVYNEDPSSTAGTTKYVADVRITYHTKWKQLKMRNTTAVTPAALDMD